MAIMGELTNFLTGGAQGNATDSSKAAIKELQKLKLPDVAEMQLQLETMVQQGQITPEEAQLFLQDQSAMNDITLDPALRQAQMDALASLQDISSQGGLTAIDKARLNDITQEENARARGAREAILSSAEARGMGGSGMSIAAQLQNAQDSATRASNRGTDVAAQAQQRALDALQAAGQLGGQIGQQDFSQQAQIAQANDAISRFNTQNKQDVSNLNTQTRNQAQQLNLAEKQRIADANAATRNTQQQYNKQLAQQDFDNRYKKAGGVASAYQNLAGQYNANAEQNMKLIGSGIEAGGKAAAASDERVKEDVEEFNPSDFLDNITGYKYKYRSPEKHGQGEQVGIMAQDLEKVAPQAVKEDVDGTKIIDYDKMGGPIMAALADLAERVKKVEGK